MQKKIAALLIGSTYSPFMKRLLAPILLFLVGSIVGYQATLPIIVWLITSGHTTPINVETVPMLALHIKFALGAGSLFAAAVIAPTLIARSSKPILWSVIYLWLGLLLSAAATVHYQMICASAASGGEEDPSFAIFTAQSAPIPWVMLVLAALLLSLGAVHRSVLGFRVKSAHRAADAR
jgi:hypothetical protein